MGKKLIGIVIVLFLVMSFSGVAYAVGPYQIGFHYVQKRVFEGNKSVNRLSLAMNDASGILSENVVNDVELFDDSGAPVSLGKVLISEIEAKYAKFYVPWYPNTPHYYFPLNWRGEAYYQRIILDDLVVGWYTILVTYTDSGGTDWTDSVDYFYRGDTFLPLVSSKSIKYKFDQAGDFYFYWTIPAKDVFKMDHTLFGYPETYPQIRAMVQRYNNDGAIYEYWTEMPYLSSGVYVPADSGIFDDPELIDRIEIGVQFRIRDNSSRTYSNWKKIKLPN